MLGELSESREHALEAVVGIILAHTHILPGLYREDIHIILTIRNLNKIL